MLAALVLSALIAALPAPLQDERVCVVGDSIVNGGTVSTQLEVSILARQPWLNVDVFAWGYDAYKAGNQINAKLPDLAERGCDRVVLVFGMNDGLYTASTSAIRTAYANALGSTIDRVRELFGADVDVVVLGPPPVEPATYVIRNGCDGVCYNDALAQLQAVAESVAATKGVAYANLHAATLSAYEALVGVPATIDGIHPTHVGGLILATAIASFFGDVGPVDALEIDTASGAAHCLNCELWDVDVAQDDVSFVRFDQAQPLIAPTTSQIPTEVHARAVYDAMPLFRALNAYTLRVVGLEPGDYRLSLDGVDGPLYTDAEVAAGVDLGDLDVNHTLAPLANQQLAVLARTAGFGAPPNVWDRFAVIKYGKDKSYNPSPGTSVVCPLMDVSSCAVVRAGYFAVPNLWRGAYHAAAQPAPHTWRLRRVGP